MGRAWSEANWELERSPAPLGIVKPHCPSLDCLYLSVPVLSSPKEVATVIINSMYPQSYFITKMFGRHARILKHLLLCRMYQLLVLINFFTSIFQELTRFLGNETYAETGELKQGSSNIVQAIGQAYRVSFKIIQPTFTAYKSGQYSSRH